MSVPEILSEVLFEFLLKISLHLLTVIFDSVLVSCSVVASDSASVSCSAVVSGSDCISCSAVVSDSDCVSCSTVVSDSDCGFLLNCFNFL